MYATTSRFVPATDTEGPFFRVRCGTLTTHHGFDHGARDAAENAIREHHGACPGCKRMTEAGYLPLFATLPTHSGKDGDTIAVWLLAHAESAATQCLVCGSTEVMVIDDEHQTITVCAGCRDDTP